MGPNRGTAKRKWILLLIGVTGCLVLLGAIYLLSPFPKSESKSIDLPNRFEVPVNTGFELQGKNQCAAFSTAFVLRNFGLNETGSEVYGKIRYKIPISGYVLPKGILSYIKSHGYSPTIYKGNLDSLKTRLVEGNTPIIVLVGNGLFWQHYMTMLGYDNEKHELYFFDSGRAEDENSDSPGNRTMAEEYFLKWWANGLPIFNHVYIAIEKAM